MNKKRVLIVENDEIMANLERKSLEATGFDVDIAVDGLEGLQKVKDDGYEVIISDFSMPRMNGEEFYKEVKRLGRDLDRRLIFVTGFINDFIESTGNRYLRKPFTSEQLVQTIEDLLKIS